MMNDVQSVLLGALLLYPKYAPEVLPDLEIEHFRKDLQDTFAAKNHPERNYLFRLSKNKEGDVGDLPIAFNKQIQRFEKCI